MKKKIYLFVLTMWIVALGLPGQSQSQEDPYYESFFQYTRLIMSREEIEIYKHLPDNQARLDFIREFWEKRDPTPDTEANENKAAFARRIQYANKWFHEGRGSNTNKMGWNTLRGRIFLQIGPPTERQMQVLSAQDRYGHLTSTQRGYVEYWFYDNYNLMLKFIANRYNEYEFWGRPPASLGRALREVKHQFNFREQSPKRPFQYTVKYKNNQLRFKLPTKFLSFAEQEDQVSAAFHIEVFLYRDYQKIDHRTFQKEVIDSKGSILGQKNLEFGLDYSLDGTGPFYMEVIVTELNSGSVTRNTLKTRG